MKQMLFGLVLLLATSALAQYPAQQPPQSTPPTFPQGQQAPDTEQSPRDQMPPDQDAPSQRMSTAELQQQIQQSLNSEPGLRDNKVDVRVTEASIFLSGTVDSEAQHELALRVAGSYAGDRQLIDKIKVRQQT